MANQLKGFRLPVATLAQLEWLINHGHGGQSAVVVKALDRLYHEERARAQQQPQAAQMKGEDDEGHTS